ncbi:MAG: aminopeptidase [Clostridiales bacterium]|nr:aminopeptidase [Clostridiales bacterium]
MLLEDGQGGGTMENRLEKYAKLAVEVGINLKSGEGLAITTDYRGVPLAREAVKHAYRLGAKDVQIFYSDSMMTLSKYENASEEALAFFPKWQVDAICAMYEDDYHHLYILTPDPELLKDVPSDKVAAVQKKAAEAMSPAVRYRITGQTKWSIVAMPTQTWADSVFPDLPAEEALEKLWEKVAYAVRLDCEDPVEAWRAHDRALKKYRDYLNDASFEKLKLTAPGTALEITLAEGHNWMGGSKESFKGDAYVANIPTEEVFTTPHRMKVNGTVKATKPLSVNGKLIDHFGFEFKDGCVTDFYAGKGADVLKKLLENDEGACRLGEVALVPNHSPISDTDILFNNTLFDENASVHLALGRAYTYAMRDGNQMTPETLEEKGANNSLIHVDFMIGGPEMTIVAYSKDGSTVTLFDKGNWTF